MSRELAIYGNPILRKAPEDVILPDENLGDLIDEMFEIMYRERGVGLAAPQIGLDMRLAVIDIGRRDVERLVLINPEIVSREGECVAEEGCLSIPGIAGSVKRPREVVVETSDLSGKRKGIRCTGLLARVVEHEVDHLAGVLVIDRMSTVERSLLGSKLRRIRKRASKQQ